MTSTHKRDTLYSQIQLVPYGVPKADMTVVLGVMSAKEGSHKICDDDVVGMFWLGRRLDKGNRLVDCCQLNGLTIGGNLFPHRNIHKAHGGALT